MKRIGIIFVLIALYCLGIAAQEQKRKRFYSSVAVGKAFQINDWFDNNIYNDIFQNLNSFNISYRLDWRLRNNWGIWGKYEFDIPHGIKPIPSDFNLFSEVNINDYYMKDIKKMDDDNEIDGISIKAVIGGFYKQEGPKWIYTYSIGLGLQSIGAPRLSYTLKQKDSNTAYDIRYSWFGHRKGSPYNPLMFLYAEAKVDRKISRKISLALGASYSYFLARPEFTGGIYDYYDQTLIREICQKGNYGHSIGISVGIGFW